MDAAIGGAIIFLGMALVASAGILVSTRLYREFPDFVRKLARYALIGIFFAVFSGAALAIGLRIDSRHTTTYSRSLKAVEQIWGGRVQQSPPAFGYDVTGTEEYTNEKTGRIETRNVQSREIVGIASQAITTKVKANVRRKGLLQFAGYDLSFDGDYVVRNRETGARTFHFFFPLPREAGNITDIQIQLDGQPYSGDTNLADGFQWSGRLGPGEERRFQIAYRAKGTDRFEYELGATQLELGKLRFEMNTDFTDYRMPESAMTPTSEASDDSQTRLTWESANLVSGQNIALEFQIPGNYGSLASKLFYYAPLALLLFTGFLLVVNAAKEIRLHPMHFLFLMTGFFVFYLFGSYIISFVHILLGIALALALSSGIMIYYAYLIRKGPEFLQSVALGAAMFQWLFSIAFFFPAYTGLMITLAAIVALVLLMRTTAAIEWEDKW